MPATSSLANPRIGVSTTRFVVLRNSVALSGAKRVTGGSFATTVHVASAGVGSTFPAASIARTWNVWVPGRSTDRRIGLVQGKKPVLALSSRHWNFNADDAVALSVPWNDTSANTWKLGSGGTRSNCVSGGVPSTVHVMAAPGDS